MINIDNLHKQEDWPTTAFLYGDKILHQDIFDILANASFAGDADKSYAGRKSITTTDLNDPSVDPVVAKCLLALQEYSNNHNILKALFTKAFENEETPLWRFWHHGIQAIDYYQRNVHIMFVEDEPGIVMDTHCDHREVFGNLQVYISPDEPNIGTIWHKHDDYSIQKVSPFVPNSGYFSVNTNQSVHSFKNTSNSKRRSLIISWTM